MHLIDVEDKEAAFAKLLDKVNESAALVSYLENLDVEITDPDIKEYYATLVGNK